MLQKSARPRLADEMSVSDDGSTPSPTGTTPTGQKIIKTELSASNIDPALSGILSPGAESESGETAEDKAQGTWVENMRVIEALRKFVSDRLKNGEYEADEEDTEMKETKLESQGEEQPSLYPTLRTQDE